MHFEPLWLALDIIRECTLSFVTLAKVHARKIICRGLSGIGQMPSQPAHCYSPGEPDYDWRAALADCLLHQFFWLRPCKIQALARANLVNIEALLSTVLSPVSQ